MGLAGKRTLFTPNKIMRKHRLQMKKSGKFPKHKCRKPADLEQSLIEIYYMVMDIYRKTIAISILAITISTAVEAQNCTETLYKLKNLLCSAYNPRTRMCVQYKRQEFYNLSCSMIIDNIVSEHPKDIHQINIYNSSINVKAGIFDEFKNVQSITITGSVITDIAPDVFTNLMNLQTLNFTENNIDVLYEKPFGNGTMIKLLDLSKNKISAVEDILLEGLPNLTSLLLGNNRISDASFLMDNCRNLSVLDLSYNNIEEIILSTGCSRLKDLKLNNNRIKEFSVNFGELVALESLYLASNDIHSIKDEDLKHLSSLKLLDISNNPLFYTSEIPVDYFSNKEALQHLNLSNTGVQSIILGTFTNLKSLKTLDLSHNNLDTLPSGIFHDLSGLLRLYLNDNRFTFFDYDGFASRLVVNLDNNMWDCDTLSNIAKSLRSKNVIVGAGSVRNTTNIFGVSCFEMVKNRDERRNVTAKDYDLIFSKSEENLLHLLEQQQNIFNLSIVYQQNQSAYYKKFYDEYKNNMEEIMVNISHVKEQEKLTGNNQELIKLGSTYRSMMVGIYCLLFLLSAAFSILLFIVFKSYRKNNRDEFQILNNFDI